MRNVPVIQVSIQPEGSPKVRVDVSDRVISMQYQDCEHQADKLELTIDNEDLSNFDDPIWRKGNMLTISWGYPEAMAVPRTCQIRKVMGFKQLTIEALGKEVLLNVETKTRVFENTRRSEVVRFIAEEWGFRDEALLHIQDTEVEREHIVQARMTDAQFLRRLAKKEGYEWYIDYDGFHFHERDFYQRSIRTLVYYSGDSVITDITIENDVTRRAGSVKMKTHNPTTRRTIDVNANNLNQAQRAVLGAIVEAPGKTEASTPGFKSISHHVIGSTTETSETAAQRHAASHLRLAQQRAVKCNITMEGDPNIHAKTVIELLGVGKRLSQLYYVRGTSHVISGAYTMSLECISDGSGGHSTKSILAKEASAVQVGPRLKGKKLHQPTPRRTLDTNAPKPLAVPIAPPATNEADLQARVNQARADLLALQSASEEPEPSGEEG